MTLGTMARRCLPAGLALALGLMTAPGCTPAGTVPDAGSSRSPSAEQLARFAQSEGRLRSPDADARRQAAVALLSTDYPPALHSVIDTIGDAPDLSWRITAIQAAGFVQDHRTFDAVLSAIGDPAPDVQAAAAAALARFTRPEEVDAMTELVRRPETVALQRQLLFGALGEALAVRAVPVLLAGLQDEDEATRIAALQALRTLSRRDTPMDVQAWEQWWQINTHRSREDVLDEHLQAISHDLQQQSADLADLLDEQEELLRLVGLGRSETPKRLLEALASRHATVRLYSSSRLAALSKEGANGLKVDAKDYDTLKAALADREVQVRRNSVAFAVRANGDYRDELVRRALNDEDPEVLTTAVEAVRPGTGPEARARLEQLLAKSGHAEVRAAAANALGKVGTGESVSVLTAALADGEENVRWFAVEGLRKLGATQAVPVIAEVLSTDGSARVREIAAGALGDLGQPAGAPALIAALDDEGERVQQKAAAALLLLATDSPERMALIASALQERGILDAAEQVLARIVAHYGDDAEASPRLVDAYRRLAQVREQRGDVAGAATAYEGLDQLTGGALDVRRELVRCYLAGDAAPAAVAAIEGWLAEAASAESAGYLDLALGSAEALIDGGRSEPAGRLLDAAAGAAGQDEAVAARIEQLRGRLAQ